MKIAAVICEYDPFHNGHQYLIAETRRRTSCDGVVCIMSGSFTQRGAPATCDKWLRAEAALLGGADAVIELPFYYAVSSAQFFALGGVGLARAIGADVLAFGSESGASTVFDFAARKSDPAFNSALRRAISAGSSYAAAATLALTEKTDVGTDPVLNTGSYPRHESLKAGTDPEVNSVAGVYSETGGYRIGPNDILGAEYVAAASRIGYAPEWCIVPREGAGHGEEVPVGRFSSATFLRAQLGYSDWEARISPFVPESTLILLKKWRETEQFVVAERFSGSVTALLRGSEAELTEKLPFGGGGVGRLIHKNTQKYTSWGAIVRESTSARYQSSRISRLLVHALVSLNSKDRLSPAELDRVYVRGAAPYVRVLGMRTGSGQSLLSEISNRLQRGTTLVTSPADYLHDLRGDRPLARSTRSLGAKMLMADIRAQSIYNSVLVDAARAAADRDLTQKMLRVPAPKTQNTQ